MRLVNSASTPSGPSSSTPPASTLAMTASISSSGTAPAAPAASVIASSASSVVVSLSVMVTGPPRRTALLRCAGWLVDLPLTQPYVHALARRLRPAGSRVRAAQLRASQGPPGRPQTGPGRPGGDRRWWRADHGPSLRWPGRGDQPGRRRHGIVAGHVRPAPLLVDR